MQISGAPPTEEIGVLAKVSPSIVKSPPTVTTKVTNSDLSPKKKRLGKRIAPRIARVTAPNVGRQTKSLLTETALKA